MTAEPLTPEEDGEPPTCHELDHLQISVLEQRLDAARKASPPLDVEAVMGLLAALDANPSAGTLRERAEAFVDAYARAALDPTA